MITNYIVEKREDKEGTEWELVSSSISGTSCRVPSLIDSAGYFFRVYAQNRYGNSEPLELTSPILIKSQLGKFNFHINSCFRCFVLYIHVYIVCIEVKSNTSVYMSGDTLKMGSDF